MLCLAASAVLPFCICKNSFEPLNPYMAFANYNATVSEGLLKTLEGTTLSSASPGGDLLFTENEPLHQQHLSACCQQ